MQSGVKKVLFVLPALTAGGAERVLITLMNGIDRSRFAPVFVTVSESGRLRDLIDPAIPYHSLNKKRVLASLLALRKKLKEINPDIAVSTMAHMNFALLMLKPFFPNTKFIVREAITPGFIIDEHPALAPAIRHAYKILYPTADQIISPAQAIIDEFKALLKMERGNFVLLHNPVNTAQIRVRENGTLPPRQENAVQFIAAGRLHRQKGFDRLIEALADYGGEDWRLTILGEGPERGALEALAIQKGLQDKISLPGHSAEPWPHYAAADCFLMPSRHEGLPNAVLEALACGTPVIATRESGGIAEIAKQAGENVTVAGDMKAFASAMEKVQARPAEKFRPSLLPPVYEMNTVIRRFEDILFDA